MELTLRDYKRVESLTKKHIKKGMQVRDSMRIIADYLSQKYPNPAWKKTQKFDYDKDIKECTDRLEHILNASVIPKSVDIIWLRLCHASGPRTDIEIAGYKGEIDSELWSNSKNLKYWPEICLVKSSILESFYNLAYFSKSPLERILDSTLSIAYASHLAWLAIGQLHKHFHRSKKLRYLFVGWDPIEGYYLGKIPSPSSGKSA